MTEAPCAERSEPGAFALAEDGRRWVYRGGLTFEDASRVLAESQALPLPKSGLVDLAGLRVADSAALAVLTTLKRRASAEHHKLRFEGLPPGLVALARVYGIEDVIGIAS